MPEVPWGNIATELSITAVEPTRALECRTSPPLLVVEPQDIGSAVVHVHGRRPWFGQSTSRTVQITASSPALTLTETARFTQKPRIPRGVHTALILRALNGSPNTGEEMELARSVHEDLSGFVTHWLAR